MQGKDKTVANKTNENFNCINITSKNVQIIMLVNENVCEIEVKYLVVVLIKMNQFFGI